MYIQDIESTYESTTKGKYFLITTKTDYKKASIEAKDMLKYIYPNRPTNHIQYSSPPNESPIIHNNVSTYAQVVMQFHESNPVPETSSHKRLKLHFHEKSNSNKRNATKESSQPIHNKNETKSITSISSKSRGETKSVTFDDEEEPTTSFQQRLKKFGTPPQVINPTNQHLWNDGYPSSLQQQANGGRGRGAYARYGGGRGGRGKGPGYGPSKGYSEYRDKAQNSATMETEDDTITDSEKSENWKDQVEDMMKDLRKTIMVDVKAIMNENMKHLMKEMVVSIRHNIIDAMNTQTPNSTTILTPTNSPEIITQSPNPTLQQDELNNISEDMDIEKSPNKRKAPTPSNENEQDDKETKDDPSDSARKNKERAAARKSRLNKTQQKGHNQS